MIAAHEYIDSKFAVRPHQRKLVDVSLVVEQLNEILLRSLDVAHMDERDAPAEMPDHSGERVCRTG